MDEIAAALGRFGELLHGVGRRLEAMTAGFTRLDYIFALVLGLGLALLWLRQARMAEGLARIRSGATGQSVAEREEMERQAAAFGELWLAVDRLDRSTKELEAFGRSVQTEIGELRDAQRRQDILLMRLQEAEQARRREVALQPAPMALRTQPAQVPELEDLRARLDGIAIETARIAGENTAAHEKLAEVDRRIAEFDRLAEGARSLIRRLKMLTPRQSDLPADLVTRIEQSASRDLVEELRQQVATLALEAERSRNARQRALGQLASLGRAYQSAELGSGSPRRLTEN